VPWRVHIAGGGGKGKEARQILLILKKKKQKDFYLFGMRGQFEIGRGWQTRLFSN
jgi:hypothetical protein